MEDNVLKLIKLIICAIYETFFFFFFFASISLITLRKLVLLTSMQFKKNVTLSVN